MLGERRSRRRGSWDRALPADRPIGFWPFLGVAVASFGGPLALAALNAPLLAADAAGSAGLEMAIGGVVFLIPLGIWLRYSREVTSSGGLYAFVNAAAGRRVALVQAGLWTVSYLLYLIYTTVQVVYDVLPASVAGEGRYQTALALLIPVALVAVMTARRGVLLVVIGAIAAGQVVLAGVLDGVTLAHISTPVSSLGTTASRGPLVAAAGQNALLYVCGSLPLFLGGELARPGRTIRRGLPVAYGLTALIVLLAVAPLAAMPGLLRTDVPGVSVMEQFASPGLATAIGVGVAVSIVGVMLCEYVALTRLAHAVSARRVRQSALVIGLVLIAAAPFSLIDPEGFYSALLKPSLAGLWLSQLVVFAVYPRFAVRRGGRALPAWSLGTAASGLAVYGLITTLQQAGS